MLTGLDIYYGSNCSHGSAGYMFCKKPITKNFVKLKSKHLTTVVSR